jgi:cytochrome P450
MEDGRTIFNGNAGPHLGFGGGPRGCYGRRLAYMELRLVIVLLVWTFELEKCPEELSSYAGWDKLTHVAQQCYVRLRKLS